MDLTGVEQFTSKPGFWSDWSESSPVYLCKNIPFSSKFVRIYAFFMLYTFFHAKFVAIYTFFFSKIVL